MKLCKSDNIKALPYGGFEAKSLQKRALSFILMLALWLNCGGKGDINIANATPLGVDPTTDGSNKGPNGDSTSGSVVTSRLFSFQPGDQVSFKVLSDGTEVGGSPIIDDFDGDGMNNTDEITTNLWAAEYPQITTRIVTPVTMEVEALSYQTGLTGLGTYTVSADDLTATNNTGSERFYLQTLSAQAGSYEKNYYPSGVPSGQTSDFITPGLGFFSLAGKSSGYNNGSSWTQYAQPAPISVMNIDGGFSPDVNIFSYTFKDDFSANASAQYRIWKRDKVANSYQFDTNAGKVRLAMYIKNSGSNVPVRLANILAALIFQTRQGQIITAANFRLRDVSSANLYSVEMNANTEFGPYLIEVPNISTDLIEKAIRFGYTPQVRLLDYDMTHPTNSPFRLSLNFTGDNLKVMENNAKGRTAKINIISPGVRQSYSVSAFMTSTEDPLDACAPVATPDATSTASPGAALSRALDRAACSMAVGGKVGGIPVIEYQNYVLDFTGVPLYDSMNPKIVFVQGIKKIGSVVNSVNCDPAVTNACYIRFADYLTSPNNNFAIWTVFAKGQYFNYSQFDYVNTSGSGTVRGYPSGTFNSNTRTGAIPRLKGVASTVWAGDTYDVVYMKVSDIVALRAEPEGTPMESGKVLSFNTKWDNGTIGPDPFAPDASSKFLGKATLGDTVELTFNLKDTTFLNPDFGPDVDSSSNLAFNQFTYNKQQSSKKFTVDQAIDFELSLGLGNQASDWQNVLQGNTCIVRPKTIGSEEIKCIKTTTDFVNQKFIVQVQLPASHHLASAGSLMNLYLRPTLSNAYRNSIWPQDFRLIKKYDTTVNASVATGAILQVKSGTGSVADILPGSDTLKVVSAGIINSYPIFSISAPTAYGYDIILGSGVVAPINVGDRAYVDAGLTAPNFSMNIDRTSAADNFFTTYTNQYGPQQMLLADSTTAVNCPLVFAPTKCYGYTSTASADYVVNNWIGNAGYANNWADALAWSDGSFLSKNLNPFLTASFPPSAANLAFKFNNHSIYPSVLTDSLISMDHTSGLGQPKVFVLGNKALVVWNNGANTFNRNLRARLVDLSAGVVNGSGGEFSIAANPSFFEEIQEVVSWGNRVIVTWFAQDQFAETKTFRARVFDMNNALPFGNEMTIVTIQGSGTYLFAARAVVIGDKAIIAWQQSTNYISTDWDIRGRTIDLLNTTPTGADFLVSTLQQGHQQRVQLANSGNYVLLAWNSSDGLDFDVRARIFNMNTNQFLADDFLVNQTTNFVQNNVQVAASGAQALFVWESGDLFGTNAMDIFVRKIDVTNGNFLSSEFQVNETTPEFQTNTLGMNNSISISAGKAFVVWQSFGNQPVTPHQGIRGRFIDFATSNFLGGDFRIDQPTVANMPNYHEVRVKESSFIVTWLSDESPNPLQLQTAYAIRSRLFEFAQGGSLRSGNEFKMSTNYPILTQVSLGFGVNPIGIAAFSAGFDTVSSTPDTKIYIRPILYGPENGLNNFFTAPLIERNYDATAQIVK